MHVERDAMHVERDAMHVERDIMQVEREAMHQYARRAARLRTAQTFIHLTARLPCGYSAAMSPRIVAVA
jgi:hypothetical protein